MDSFRPFDGVKPRGLGGRTAVRCRLCLVLLLLVPAAVRGQVPSGYQLTASDLLTVTLEQVEAAALQNNPTLAQAAARVEAARGKWLQGGLPPNPEVGYAATEVGNEGRAGQQGIYFQQEFVTGGKLGLNRQVAAAEIRAAEQAFHAQRLRVLTDVRRQDIALLAAQSRLGVARESLTAAKESQRKAEDAAANAVGDAQRGAAEPRSQVETQMAELTIVESASQLMAARRRLAAVTGVADCGVHVLGNLHGDLPHRDWCASLAVLMEQSPDRAAAFARAERAAAALSRAMAEPTPNVTVQAVVQHDTSTRDLITSVQATVPIPIYNRNQGNIHRARAELTAARLEVGRVELGLRWRLAAEFQRYTAARARAKKYGTEIVPKAAAAWNTVQRVIKQGVFQYNTLLDSQRTYFRSRLDEIDALRDLHQSVAAIDGLLLSGSLEAD